MATKNKIGFSLLAITLVLLFWLAVSSCQNNDDGDNDDKDTNQPEAEWTYDGCQYDLNKSQQYLSAETPSPSSLDDCLPPLPEGIDPLMVETILDAILGEYVDEAGNHRWIDCRPEGHWSMPYEDPDPEVVIPCAYDWTFPVWVRFDQQGTDRMEGSISHGYTSDLDFVLWQSARLYFQQQGQNYEAAKSHLDYEVLQWTFSFPETCDWIWTKVE